jgi:hypothetical protein
VTTRSAEGPAADRLSDSWLRWVAENLARGAEEDELAGVLAARGLDAEAARELIAEIAAQPAMAAARGLAGTVDKLEKQLDEHDALQALLDPAGEVRRVKDIEPDDFVERFYAANRPVVLSGLIGDWPALERWTPEYLRERFGEQTVDVETGRKSEPIWQVLLKANRQPWRFADYIDAVMAAGETNGFYMTAADGLLSRPGMASLLDDIRMPRGFLDPAQLDGNAQFWFGPAGTVSPLHRDEVNVFLCQVRGRKRIRFVASSQLHRVYNRRSFYSEVNAERPDLERFPRFAGLRVLEAVVGPGDVAFIPVGWWHHVRALDVSISVTMTNFEFPNPY